MNNKQEEKKIIQNTIDIINKLKSISGQKEKLIILKENQNNELLKKVLKLTYNKIEYKYGVSFKSLRNIDDYNFKSQINLKKAIDILNHYFIGDNKLTGNKAKQIINQTIEKLSKEEAIIFVNILKRNQEIGLADKQLNKIFPGIIPKPLYMRCDIPDIKKLNKILNQDKLILQVKADGTYREVRVQTLDDGNKEVIFISRSGETSNYPIYEKEFKKLEDGIYMGELLLDNIKDRSMANGLINSDNPPQENFYMQLWDYLTHEEYEAVAKKDKNFKYTPYEKRLENLKNIIDNKSEKIKLIKTKYLKVNENILSDVVNTVQKWIKENGEEGGVLKSPSNIYKNTKATDIFKAKPEIEAEVRITGYEFGNKGYVAFVYKTDDNKIKGKVYSGMTKDFQKQLKEDIKNNKFDEKYNNKIISIKATTLSKSENSDSWSLMHPRISEIREDKDYTDTLERVQEMENSIQILKGLKEKDFQQIKIKI